MNNDGYPDIVAGNWDLANRVYTNNGNGTFSDSGQALGNYYTRAIRLADLNGDGYLDILEGNDTTEGNRAWINGGLANPGIFTDSGFSIGTYDTRSIGAADLDGDDDVDFIAGNELGTNAGFNLFWINGGLGTFSNSGQLLGLTNHNTYGLAVGDLDGDGDIDCFAGNSSTTPCAVYLNQ